VGRGAQLGRPIRICGVRVYLPEHDLDDTVEVSDRIGHSRLRDHLGEHFPSAS
jgi:hypothetical protein